MLNICLSRFDVFAKFEFPYSGPGTKSRFTTGNTLLISRKIHCFQYHKKKSILLFIAVIIHIQIYVIATLPPFPNIEYSERIMIVEESIGNKIKFFINKLLLSRSYLALNLTWGWVGGQRAYSTLDVFLGPGYRLIWRHCWRKHPPPPSLISRACWRDVFRQNTTPLYTTSPSLNGRFNCLFYN